MEHFKKLFTFRQRLFPIFLLALAMLSFFLIDRQVLPWIVPLSKTYRPFFKLFSNTIFPPFLLILWIGAFFFARFSKVKRGLSGISHQLFEIATAQCLSVAVVRLTKVLIGRARPDIFLKRGIYGFHGVQLDPHYHSFPSGHTMAAFTLATSLALLYPRYRLQFYFAAFIFSISRVLLAKHYFSDILGTAAVAIAIAMLTHTILEKITGRVTSSP